jgi:hypothetical protein
VKEGTPPPADESEFPPTGLSPNPSMPLSLIAIDLNDPWGLPKQIYYHPDPNLLLGGRCASRNHLSFR